VSHHRAASRPRGRSQRGFTLLETMVAIVVITAGLIAVGALVGNMHTMTSKSRYVSVQAYLASEKMDEMSRYPGNQYSTNGPDPNIWAPDGGTAGDLTTQSTATVTSGGTTVNVDYYDLVQISAGQGTMSETTKRRDLTTNAVTYTTISQDVSGTFTTSQSATAPTVSSDSLYFERRWLIEKDPPGLPKGVRRITVVVLDNNASAQTKPFQVTMVRP
jgi:prepilin-type N-terminal cleavage/methylation domain-containing protein